MAFQYAEPGAGLAVQREAQGEGLPDAAPYRAGYPAGFPCGFQWGAGEPGGDHGGIPGGHGGAYGYGGSGFRAGEAPKRGRGGHGADTEGHFG